MFRALMGQYRVPQRHRAERKTPAVGTLDSTKDGVAGRGTPELPKGLVNPMEWHFTGHSTTIKRVLGQGNTSHYSLKEH